MLLPAPAGLHGAVFSGQMHLPSLFVPCQPRSRRREGEHVPTATSVSGKCSPCTAQLEQAGTHLHPRTTLDSTWQWQAGLGGEGTEREGKGKACASEHRGEGNGEMLSFLGS